MLDPNGQVLSAREACDARVAVVERFLMSKQGDPDGGEDGIFVNEHYAVVVDGASAKGTWFLKDAPATSVVPGPAPGRRCRDALLEALPSLPPYLDGWSFVCRLNEVVRTLRAQLPAEAGLPQASVVAFSAAQCEVWSFGDCACIVNGQLHSERKAIDVRHADQRRQVLEEALAKGATVEELLSHDVGRLAILDGLHQQQRHANATGPLGYPVLDGGAFRREQLRCFRVPAPCEVVLSSDGYPQLKDTLAASEAHLAEVLATDPLMMRLYPETKGCYRGQVSYDDRSYLRLTVTASEG